MTAVDLDRFVEAQRGTYQRALAELHAGAKQSHWMWFVFPQIAGLGRSETARLFAIHDLGEARAYLDHPILGARLHEATGVVLDHAGRTTAEALFGAIDAVKLRSSMTLFESAGGPSTVGAQDFAACLNMFFSGHRDDATIDRL